MCELNFTDLLALIVEYDIESVKEYYKIKQKEKNDERGINVIPASNEQIIKMHSK